jgi:predicted butyrate kinase (DUF1464 family)
MKELYRFRQFLTEGVIKENIDFPELEDEFEGAMDAMVVEPEVYLQDIINASPEEIVSDDYYEVMNAVEQGVYSEDEAVELAKAWAKEKLSTLSEGVVKDMHTFLNDLRDSGVTNMFGAAPYLQDEFGLDKREARQVLANWMQSFSENLDEMAYERDSGVDFIRALKVDANGTSLEIKSYLESLKRSGDKFDSVDDYVEDFKNYVKIK